MKWMRTERMKWMRTEHIALIGVITQVLLMIAAVVAGIAAFHGNSVNLHLVFLSVQSVLFGMWINQFTRPLRVNTAVPPTK